MKTYIYNQAISIAASTLQFLQAKMREYIYTNDLIGICNKLDQLLA